MRTDTIWSGRTTYQPWSAHKNQNPRLGPPSLPLGTVLSTRQKTSQSVDMTSLSRLGSVNTPGASLDQTTLAYGPKYWQQVGPPGSRFGHQNHLRSPLAKHPTKLTNSPCKCTRKCVSNASRFFCASCCHEPECIQWSWSQHSYARHAGQSDRLPGSRTHEC